MQFPVHCAQYHIPGFTLRALGPQDRYRMMAVRESVMAALPDPRWYFPMEDREIDEWLAAGSVVGYLDGDVLAGFASIMPWHMRTGHAYAEILGEEPQDTYDFHDVMVQPAYRGHRMHQHFLQMFADMAREAGGRVIYATVDPDNKPSWYNFEKAGYRCVLTQPAYDGRIRRYYRLAL